MKHNLVVRVLPDLSLAARTNEIYKTHSCSRHVEIDLSQLSDEALALVATALSSDGTRLWRITKRADGLSALVDMPLRAWPLSVDGVIAALKSCLDRETHPND